MSQGSSQVITEKGVPMSRGRRRLVFFAIIGSAILGLATWHWLPISAIRVRESPDPSKACRWVFALSCPLRPIKNVTIIIEDSRTNSSYCITRIAVDKCRFCDLTIELFGDRSVSGRASQLAVAINASNGSLQAASSNISPIFDDEQSVALFKDDINTDLCRIRLLEVSYIWRGAVFTRSLIVTLE
jgi:hypothetical protein